MFIRKFTALAVASLMLANCASTPGPEEESFCDRTRPLCVFGAIAVVVLVIAAAAGAQDDIGMQIRSDIRLKRDVRPVETLPNGVQLYSFRYWNDDRTFVSVMAQDLLKDARFRHAVTQDESGYYLVDLGALGLGVAGSRSQFYEAGQNAMRAAEPVTN